ncbi:Uncharacterised protein [Mycobacteroides abscessus subsp. abscessus]|nr:Uncharacterised protein [Mycobacteroides abscessus subsp. abscessus]
MPPARYVAASLRESAAGTSDIGESSLAQEAISTGDFGDRVPSRLSR